MRLFACPWIGTKVKANARNQRSTNFGRMNKTKKETVQEMLARVEAAIKRCQLRTGPARDLPAKCSVVWEIYEAKRALDQRAWPLIRLSRTGLARLECGGMYVPI